MDLKRIDIIDRLDRLARDSEDRDLSTLLRGISALTICQFERDALGAIWPVPLPPDVDQIALLRSSTDPIVAALGDTAGSSRETAVTVLFTALAVIVAAGRAAEALEALRPVVAGLPGWASRIYVNHVTADPR